jgi:ADP-heptose:LPS heptosyltransferase
VSGVVLAIRPRALGDVVLVTPALRALAAGHPGSALEVVTEARYAPLIEGLPGVSQVWRLERSTAATAALGERLRRRGIAACVDFFGNPRSAYLCARSGAPLRAGYALRGRERAYTLRVPRTTTGPDGRREYAAATHVRLAVAAGGREDGLDARIALDPRAGDEAGRLLATCGIGPGARAIGVVAAGTWPAKTWPASHAASLCRRLIASGRRLVLIAGPGEEPLAERIATLAPGLRVLPPCGVAAMAAVVARLAAVIGTDSGPRHVAAALGVPTFAWFGPTHPDTWNPPGEAHGRWFADLPCRGCDRTACPHWSCMPSLAPEAAAARVEEHLSRHVR